MKVYMQAILDKEAKNYSVIKQFVLKAQKSKKRK